MTILTLVTLSLSILGLSLSIVALFVTLRSSDRSLYRRFVALSEHSSELSVRMDAQEARIKAVRGQLSAAKMKLASADDPEADTRTTESAKDAWQRETNLKIARGEINPLRRLR